MADFALYEPGSRNVGKFMFSFRAAHKYKGDCVDNRTKLAKSFKTPPAGTSRELVIEIFDRLCAEYGLHFLPKLALFRELQRIGIDQSIVAMVDDGYLIETDFDHTPITSAWMMISPVASNDGRNDS